MSFPPIAIVGQSCLLPGAQTPGELWRLVVEGRDALRHTPRGRWRMDPALLLEPSEDGHDRVFSDRGGYVEDFAFDATGFAIPADEILSLDPLFHWVLHTAREALRDSGHDVRGALAGGERAGAILGNLSFPTESLSRWAESVWLEEQGAEFLEGRARHLAGVTPPDPRNRFMSGLPAHFLARAFGLSGPTYALDAACASALYAIKLACDRLHDGEADLMLAGAVNRADDLFIHAGFSALQALSRTGRSRPFHRAADGLVPAEGAAFVVLKRLPDAVRAGDRILAVIRGLGLSNDGRGAGLLAPSEEGQARAMRRAYETAGLTPGDVSLLECHATGTAVGDATEVRSTGAVFGGCDGVPIGSIKSNLGHLITVAGMAGLLKVLGALREGVRPPTLHVDRPLDLIGASPLRLLTAGEPWNTSGPRRAAISAFGFGGNNAHLIVEEWDPARPQVAVPAAVPPVEIAIVALGAAVADGTTAADFACALFSGESRVRPARGRAAAGSADSITLEMTGLRFPPRDLEQTLAQQLLLLRAAREAVAQAGSLPREGTAVLAGMQCDAEVARFGARWRLAEWARSWPGASPAWLPRARDAVVRRLDVAGVVGVMPNIVANRLNSQFDLAGPSLTVSAEELSGVVALELAARALRAGEIDAALVAAVDLGAEPVHAGAAAAVLDPKRQPPGDAAVAFVLKRLEDARRDGNTVYAVLAPREPVEGELHLSLGDDDDASLTGRFGHAHAASGLVHVAAAALACSHRARPPAPGSGAMPWLPHESPRAATVSVTALGGRSATVRMTADEGAPPRPLLLEPAPRLHVFSGQDRRDVLLALRHGRESEDGPARLTVVATEAEKADRLARARASLEGTFEAPAEGIAFFERPVGGELAFVFTGPAGAYAGMGRELVLALPELVERLARRFRRLGDAAGWVYEPREADRPVEKLWGSSFLCQLHAELTRGLLGLEPQAAVGFCSGETNALFALEAWTGIDELYDAIAEARIYERELAGEFATVRRAWGEREDAKIRWENWRLLAPLDDVRAALATERRAHLTIVNAPGDCVIGGEAEACRRVAGRVGRERCRPLGYDIAVHCPELAEFRDVWRRIHHRPTTPVPGVRFYTHATGTHYQPNADSAADALLGQALSTVDFPRVVQNAWNDGVRVFLEHGPQGGCTRWIDRILGERDHLAVPLDLAGLSSVRQVANALGQLVAAGVRADHRAFAAALARAELRPEPAREGPRLTLPAHPAAVRLPPLEASSEAVTEAATVMAPAPWVPPVTAEADLPQSALPAPPAPQLVAALAAPAGPVTDLVSRLVSDQAHLVTLHREFITRQAEIHRQFLELRARLPVGGTEAPAAVLEPEAAPAPFPPTSAPTPARPPADEPGPASSSRKAARFSRRQLEALASGRISAVFGPLFEKQDGYRRQVRMPEPPLLLADRALDIEGEPGSMGKGTVWTETDVGWESWYLHDGRMPAGIMIEAGQADLLLISWLGVDFLNRGERVYRLLGCDLTYHGGLPRPGDTLRYDIHVDGHARQGEVRLFFFHYDCRIGGESRLMVRNGQAGFFTDEELAGSGGVLWDAETGEHDESGPLDPPLVDSVGRSFSADRVRAFSEGRVRDCFGDAFAKAETHVRTPRIASGRMLLLGEVADLDPSGGPWRRGYLRALRSLSADDWFYRGHFKDDPCMPGTLMFEGCLEAMAFYLAALGFTLDRDGWRFQPVPDETYRLRCRGQAIPASRQLVYEVFVEELRSGPLPTLYADLLCTVDGVKAFHCRRMGLRLAPDWPLSRRPDLLKPPVRDGAIIKGGLRLDEKALLACAWGRPTDAFGPVYRPFDGPRRLSRLPGPPYHFLSRVTRLEGEVGKAKPGAVIEVEYDVPEDAWYFDASGHRTMPFSVLLETGLQPCGWLALASGVPLETDEGLFFRNLDGTGTLTAEVPPQAGTLRSRIELTKLSRSGGIVLLSFDVDCFLDGRSFFRMETGFGFFPEVALMRQVGLPSSDEDRAWLTRSSAKDVDLVGLAERSRAVGPRLARSPLFMLDRITGWWPADGRAGLGRLRAEKDVDPAEWFFKAHFFQDPVQPGSLGLEAMLQLLQAYMLEEDLAEGIKRPRFEPIARGETLTWKYRGQVLPSNRRVVVELEVLEVRREPGSALARGNARLSVDGTSIYEVRNLSMRIVSQVTSA